MINFHATLIAPNEDEKTYLKRLYEESKRSLVGQRGNLISPLRHSEERILRRENLILKNILI